MTPEETVAYYDQPANAQAMCDLLERVFPGWTVWRTERMWHARYEGWLPHTAVHEANAGLLTLTMRLGGGVCS
ncbi:hypothetical protein ABZW11_26785 [Nonomuraea sp. NPDC004580]|uniref:hypothetical protein n=1 Tax=Nonomuraea sp. NPDC004580 TaxID=3154552 RepID=UPI0033A46F58